MHNHLRVFDDARLVVAYQWLRREKGNFIEDPRFYAALKSGQGNAGAQVRQQQPAAPGWSPVNGRRAERKGLIKQTLSPSKPPNLDRRDKL